MIQVTPAAVTKLQTLLLEHPDEAIVRITLKDLDDQRLIFGITLEAAPQPDDDVHETEGLTIAIAADAAGRMDGITLDYEPADGFRVRHALHDDSQSVSFLGPFSLN
jgi:Fe-S cluster assembly iron-binding protein IscA